MSKTNNQYFISQDNKTGNNWLWAFDPKSPTLIKKVTGMSGETIPKGNHLTQVGNYILLWSPLTKDGQFTYRLLEFDPQESDPLGSRDDYGNWTEKAVQSGNWSKRKFFGSRADFSNPDGANKGYESGKDLVLVSMHNFVLNWIPTAGRGTYQLFNFDRGSSDPLPDPVTPQGAWLTIEAGHELMHINGYVIDWKASTGSYVIWQFDAQNENPLSYPAIKKGKWDHLGIDDKHKLIVIGSYVLDWDTKSNKYRLWEFDLGNEQVLRGPINEGKLPNEITETTTFTGIETLIAKDEALADKPGTMDFMRDKIEHVVYYMIENRSFDHVCGWLYDKNFPIKVIGAPGPFKGVDKNFTNAYKDEKGKVKNYAITPYNGGKLPDKNSLTSKNGKPCFEIPQSDQAKDMGDCFILDLDQQDPYHDNSDVLRQMFTDIEDYYQKKTPDMGGFALNNGTPEVMMGYTPEQLPVLNGLAKNFAISDEWFCSMPGGTDVNRAFSLTGSSLGHLNNFQNGVQYTEWSEYPHRPSIWKVLWSNGIEDFKIYNAVEWMGCQFTYNLFLKGQIPSIDSTFKVGNYAPQQNQLYDDLKYGTLPKFAYIEPKWVASAGGSTSYHPGGDLIPGERMLNDIFNAIQESPLRDKILFVITFDEHGGIADHVPPPYAVKPYANDSIGGFDFDIMGVRIPTILVSPWISEHTVFRSDDKKKPYDSTSILATILEWVGIPKSRWGLGERTNQAPTFEAVLQEKKARKKKIKLEVPYDSQFPPEKSDKDKKATEALKEKRTTRKLPVHGLHELVVPRMIADMTPNLSRAERIKIQKEILENAPDLEDLTKRLEELHHTHNK